ncbi:DUF2141 domain-containing protein [Uliginosibacterium sp. sgz301328]|uniref:DUF2141 domain-containing protein n=1 Tax=Uliginosibacterium sp. sgz301328 TaxID=3243764 RepID=UPI00359D2088
MTSMFLRRVTRRVAACVAAAGLLAGAAPTEMAQAAPFEIAIGPLRSAEGNLRVGIYRDPASFRKEAQALKVITLPARTGRMVIKVDDLPPGRYAVMAYHDENGNDKLDLRLGMFPIEGYGLSNNPKVIGPPAFDDSAVATDHAGQRVDIEMRY